MTAAQTDNFYLTILVFGVISIAVFLVVLSPILSSRRPRNNNNNNDATAAVRGRGNALEDPTERAPRTTAAAATTTTTLSSKIEARDRTCRRFPEHIALSSARIATPGGTNVLSDTGVLAFRHSTAAAFEQSLEEDLQIQARKERARILARLIDDDDENEKDSQKKNGDQQQQEASATTTTSIPSLHAPPAKGSTLVLSIPVKDVHCSRLRRVLYLLSTFYNLLVILAVDEKDDSFSNEDRKQLIAQLRSNGSNDDDDDSSSVLSVQVLPDHRIVAAKTVAGRVAFCRQLQRIELILDFDPQVKTLLGRFGHRVRIYGTGADADIRVSSSATEDERSVSSQLGLALLG